MPSIDGMTTHTMPPKITREARMLTVHMHMSTSSGSCIVEECHLSGVPSLILTKLVCAHSHVLGPAVRILSPTSLISPLVASQEGKALLPAPSPMGGGVLWTPTATPMPRTGPQLAPPCTDVGHQMGG